ncbi:hypothetical protein TrRE_jg9245 [Triparma retinervis]|uniref:Uncharacterized protein n=1 Tax=Triparma retinervis TaxID=2557542 RepID=A0A9W7EDB6_9STRA|nr:hypothetical protein TrRE_jg9245 [Triparma retinervis]
MLILFFLALVAAVASGTVLDDYVWAPDSNYEWTDLQQPISGSSPSGVSWTGHILNVTSQQWLTPDDVDRSLWFHYLVVIIPDNLNQNWNANATLYVTGGSNTSPLPTAKDEDIRVASALATGSGTITGAFFQVPNEHVVFKEDPEQMSRTEDAIIAYTWDHFLRHPDKPEWLVRLPMVKSVLRAMDAMTEFWQSYGGFSFALEDYAHMNITTRFDDPNMVELQKIEDPYFYFDRLTLPKLVVNAVGDEFQQPDDTKNWWPDLPEPKHFLMVPNAEHSLATGIFEVVPAIGTWITKLLGEKEIPTFTWDIDPDSGDIAVDLSEVKGVKKVEKFYGLSVNNKRRDFRFVNIDDPCPMGLEKDGTCLNLRSFWKSAELQPTDGGVYVASHEKPEDGRWAAFMIQVTFEKDEEGVEGGKGGFIPRAKRGELVFTTEVSVVPDVMPYEDCYMETCEGNLV